MKEMKVRLRGGLPVREIMVAQESTPAELFAMLRPDRYTRFIVCDDAGSPLFAVGEGDLERIITQFSCSDTVISVANFLTAMIAAFVIALVNVFIKPVLLLVTLPINILKSAYLRLQN